MAGQNSNTGEAQPWPAAKSTPASSVRGLGFANRRTESTGVSGGSRGSRLGQKGGRRGRLERRPPWPTAKSFPAARKTAIQAIKRQGEGQGERGEHGGLTAGKKWVGDGSGKAVHGGSDLGGRRGFSVRRWRPPKRERGRNWSGEQERDTRGARLRLKRGRGAGRAIPRRATWARAAVAADARCGCGRKGAALTCGPGRQRLKEEREARRLQQGCA